MKGVVYKGREHVQLEEFPKPRVEEPTDSVLRVTMSAICGSDLPAYYADRPANVFALGHEFIGVVEEVGSSVEKVKPGDRVVLPFRISCGDCFYCRRGWSTQCPEMMRFGTEALLGGQAEYVRIPMTDANAFHLPLEIPDETAVLLSDIVCTGYFCAEQGGIRPGDYVAVIGCGPVGMMAQMAAQMMGASVVIAVDTNPYRLAMAMEWWGSVPLNATEEGLRERVLDLTEGRGVDVVLEAVGTTGGALDTAFDLVRPAGTVSQVGVPSVDTYSYPIRKAYTMDLTYKVGVCPAASYMPRMLHLVKTGRLLPKKVVTHVLPLGQAVEGYRLFASRESGVMKVLLKP